MAFTTVVGVFARPAVGEPDLVPIAGLKVRFVPDLPSGRVIVGEATIVDLDPVEATTDESGAFEVNLFSGDSEDASPIGWTWAVTISGADFRTARFSFLAVSDTTVDIASVIPTAANGGATAPTGDYVTQEQLDEALEGLEPPDLSAYATTAELVAAIEALPEPPDLTLYATLDAVNTIFVDAQQYFEGLVAERALTTDVTNALATKASAADLDNVFGIATEARDGLDGKANTSHTHAISDVTGLQSALDDLEGGRFLYLAIGAPVPGGTPAGTVIVRPTA